METDLFLNWPFLKEKTYEKQPTNYPFMHLYYKYPIPMTSLTPSKKIYLIVHFWKKSTVRVGYRIYILNSNVQHFHNIPVEMCFVKFLSRGMQFLFCIEHKFYYLDKIVFLFSHLGIIGARFVENSSKIIVLSLYILYNSWIIVVYAESSKIAIKTLKIAPKSLKIVKKLSKIAAHLSKTAAKPTEIAANPSKIAEISSEITAIL